MTIVPEQRVLLAAVNLAIFDACLQPIKPLNKQSDDPRDFRMQADARSAMAFLHGDGLDDFCNWLDFEAAWLRKRLQEYMYEENLLGNPVVDEELRINASRRRFYRMNYRIWLLSKDEEIPEPTDETEAAND